MMWLVMVLVLGQPIGVGAPVPEPAALVGRLDEAAHAKPCAERLDLRYTDDAGVQDTMSLVVRRAWVPGRGLVVCVEFDGIRLLAESGVVLGERSGLDHGRLVYRRETGAAGPLLALAGVIPLWPMPSLWRADEDGLILDPALGLVTPERVDRIDETLVCSGHTSAGAFRLVLDEQTLAVRTLEAKLRDGRVVLRSVPIEPGDVDSWSISEDGRRRVDRLGALVEPERPIEPGQVFPDLSLVLPGFEGAMLSDLMSADSAGPWTVLLVLDAQSDAGAYRLAGEVASGLWETAAGEIADLGPEDVARYWLGHRTVVVAVSDRAVMLVEQMDGVRRLAPRGVQLSISLQPEETIERVAAGSGVVAILLDPNRVVGGVVGIDDAQTGVEAVLSVMRSYVKSSSESDDSE